MTTPTETPDESIDLFDAIETLPAEIQDLIAETSHVEHEYHDVAQVLARFEALGYTFDYGLDAEPFNLRKMPEHTPDNDPSP